MRLAAAIVAILLRAVKLALAMCGAMMMLSSANNGSFMLIGSGSVTSSAA